MWFRTFHFREDPYVPRSPFTIPLELIRWNREDLEHQWNLNQFLDSVSQGYRTGLKAYGPSGSGKTWLMRYIQKTLVDRMGDRVAVLYGNIRKIDPTFAALYDMLIRGWSEYLPRLLERIEEQVGDGRDAWKRHVGIEDLGMTLWHLKFSTRNPDDVAIVENWLRGNRISVTELRKVGIASPLDRDYRKFDVLQKLVELTIGSFEATLLIIDEMENASASFAQALGDSLREMIDSFYDRFALACSYTAQIADAMLDQGYGEFLYRRLDWEVRLDPVRPETAPGIFRVHHDAYREPGFTGDSLLPFSEEGLSAVIGMMDPVHWYPGRIFRHCQVFGRLAADQKASVIDPAFAEEAYRTSAPAFEYLR